MSKQQKYLQQLLSGLLFIAVVIMVGYLSTQHKLELDWTAGHRNSISDASRKQLGLMKDPIKFVAFVYPDAENRSDIRNWVQRYQRFKPDVTLDFIDPSTDPQKVKEYNVDHQGEVIVEYQGRREPLNQLSERSVTGALQRLTYTGERFLVFLQGHGEHVIGGDGAGGDESYTNLADVLGEKGLKIIPLNLTQTPQIPRNAAALVIANPRNKLFDGEVKIIDDYVKAGGNVLWLADPDNPPGLEPLAKTLGVTWQNGYAIFPNYQIMQTGSPIIYVATSYPTDSPVTRELSEVTAFPGVRSLAWDKSAGWDVQPMLKTDDSSWLETSKLDDGPVTFDEKAGDISGPLTIGLTLTRQMPDNDAIDHQDDSAAAPDAAAKDKKPMHSQRVALIGDSDFMSNANLSAAGNKTFAIDLMQWLVARDDQLNIDIPKAPDSSLYLPGWALLSLAAGFVILLPIGLIGFGAARWLIRRRA